MQYSRNSPLPYWLSDILNNISRVLTLRVQIPTSVPNFLGDGEEVLPKLEEEELTSFYQYQITGLNKGSMEFFDC